MCVYMLALSVQDLAKPKSQILITGGWLSSSSVLSSFRSLHAVVNESFLPGGAVLDP